jgi:hypothetical protein
MTNEVVMFKLPDERTGKQTGVYSNECLLEVCPSFILGQLNEKGRKLT